MIVDTASPAVASHAVAAGQCAANTDVDVKVVDVQADDLMCSVM